jgi:hypothetical protein
LPVVEVEVEVRIVDALGIGVIGGIGEVPVEDELGNRERFSAYVLGGQIVAYPLEPFESLQLGAELLYVKVETDTLSSSGSVTGVGEGLAVGPLIGYKLITNGGFTLFVQGGVEYVAIRAEAQSTSGASAREEESRVIPLLNFNLGWSF